MGRILLILRLCCCTWCVLGAAGLLRGQEPPDAKLQKLADESRSRAEGIEVSVAARGLTTKATVSPTPLMKYTDVPRQIEMATLWVWQDEGRPVALGKVEAYQRKEGPKWLYCFASASTGLVDGKWPDGHRFEARKPGVEWATVGGPAGDGGRAVAADEGALPAIFRHGHGRPVEDVRRAPPAGPGAP